MKNISSALAVIVFVLCSCSQSQNKEFNQPFPLKPSVDNSLIAKWEKKAVLASKLIDDMEGDSLWSVGMGGAQLSYTSEHSKDGKRALRFHNSLLDSAYIASQRTPWGSFGGEQGGETFIQMQFNKPQDWTEYNRISAWVYIHPSKNPNVHFSIDLVEGDNIEETLTPGREMNIDIPQGEWVNVFWDIDYMRRSEVRYLMIYQTCIGYDRDMGEQYVTIDFDRIEVQKVKPDNYSGWDIDDGDFAFSHIGYRPGDKKIALTHADKGDFFNPVKKSGSFFLLDDKGRIVYTGTTTKSSNKGNDFTILDFTEWNTPGTYILKCGDAQSRPFEISDDVWLHPLFSAVNFYYCQRCGYEVPGIHSVCHQDMQGFYDDETKPINGGWHDAGDLSQGFWRTADGCLALMRCIDAVENKGTLAKRIADEAAWGVEWLLKTRFHDGRHISWVTQRIYSDNIMGNYDDVKAQAVLNTWENFQGTVVFLMATDKLKQLSDRKKELAEAAVDNWQHAMDARDDWSTASYQESAWGATASAMLYKKYGDEKYKEAALHFGQLLVSSQEQEFKDGITITGYFYNDNSRQNIIRNSHAAFDETIMIALSTLCNIFPDESDWMTWYSAAAIYCEYFMKRGSINSAPFNLVPNCVLRRSDMEKMATANGKPNYYLKQYEAGTQLSDNYAIRTFPVWDNYNFHGSTNCHLSTSWALAEAAALVGDKAGMELVQQQLEWTLGRNPFTESLMYGVGYDYSPLFVYCTQNIVGALPVGVDSYNNDEPFWHGANYATYKEIWVEPVSRFLGTLATYLISTKKERLYFATLNRNGNDVSIKLTGKGKHRVELRTFNIDTDFKAQDIELGKTDEINLKVNTVDKSKPYVMTVIVDGDTEHATTVCGVD